MQYTRTVVEGNDLLNQWNFTRRVFAISENIYKTFPNVMLGIWEKKKKLKVNTGSCCQNRWNSEETTYEYCKVFKL